MGKGLYDTDDGSASAKFMAPPDAEEDQPAVRKRYSRAADKFAEGNVDPLGGKSLYDTGGDTSVNMPKRDPSYGVQEESGDHVSLLDRMKALADGYQGRVNAPGREAARAPVDREAAAAAPDNTLAKRLDRWADDYTTTAVSPRRDRPPGGMFDPSERPEWNGRSPDGDASRGVVAGGAGDVPGYLRRPDDDAAPAGSGGRGGKRSGQGRGNGGGGSGKTGPAASPFTAGSGDASAADLQHGIQQLGESGDLPAGEQAFYERAKKILAARHGQINYKPLAALGDAWAGGHVADSIKAPETEDELRNDELALDKSHEERKTSLAQRGQELRNKWELAQAKQEMLEKYYDLKGDSSKRELALMNRIGALQARGAGRLVDTGETDENGEPIYARGGAGGKAPKHVAFGDADVADYMNTFHQDKQGSQRFYGNSGMSPYELGSKIAETAAHAQQLDKQQGINKPKSYYVSGAGAAVRKKYGEKPKPKASGGLLSWFGGSDDQPAEGT